MFKNVMVLTFRQLWLILYLQLFLLVAILRKYYSKEEEEEKEEKEEEEEDVGLTQSLLLF